MAGDSFHAVGSALTEASSRRRALSALLAGALSFVGALDFNRADADDVDAEHDTSKKCKKINDKKRRKKCLKNAKNHNAQHTLGLGSAGCSPLADDGSSASLDSEEQALLLLINNYRGANGLAPLIHNAQLGTAASLHSQDMGARNFFDHDGPGGITPQRRATQQGYCNPEGVGENIFAGAETAGEVFRGWQNSPGHNRNMLNAEYVEIGIGRAFVAGSEFGWYWTAKFAFRT